MKDEEQMKLSSLVMSEKRSPRPRGCASVFFQLFEWNRSVKRKLLSKKLLNPVHTKHLTTMCSSGKKLPSGKLILIEGNYGGYSKHANESSKNRLSRNAEPIGEMGAPSLVARLMGLDNIPVHPVQPRNTACDASGKRSGEPCSRESDFSHDSVHTFSIAHGKIEQKLHKINVSERKAPSRDGQASVQLKTILTKKHQKLPSPIKSPNKFSRRNGTRLIEAASKILEPGLQSANCRRLSVPYSGQKKHLISHSFQKNMPVFLNGSQELLHMNYNQLCDQMDNTTNDADQIIEIGSAISEYGCGGESIRHESASYMLPVYQESEQYVASRIPLVESSEVSEQKDSRNQCIRKDKVNHDDHARYDEHGCHFCQKIIKLDCQEQRGLLVKKKQSFINNSPSTKGIASSSRRGYKNGVEMHGNVICYSSSRSPGKTMSKYQLDAGKKDDSSTKTDVFVGKSSNLHYGELDSMMQTLETQNSLSIDLVGRKVNASSSANHGKIEKKVMTCHTGRNGNINYASTLPVKNCGFLQEKLHKRQLHKRTLCQRVANGHDEVGLVRQCTGALSSRQQKVVSPQYLQKAQGLDSSILQEQCAAAVVEEPVYAQATGRLTKVRYKNLCKIPAQTSCDFTHQMECNLDQTLQEDVNEALSGNTYLNDMDSPSPTSILEASFSNTSLDDGSVKNTSCHSTNCLRPSATNSGHIELFDKPDTTMEISFMSCISKILLIFPDKKGLENLDLSHAFDVISTVGQLLANRDGPIVDSILMDKLEKHACTSMKCHDLRLFLFSCILEWLEKQILSYGLNCHQNIKLLLYSNKEHFERKVYREIIGWSCLAGRTVGELMEEDIWNLSIEWMNFEIEVTNICNALEFEILNSLLEMLTLDFMDMWSC